MRGVLDNFQAVTTGEGGIPDDISNLTSVMDRHDGLDRNSPSAGFLKPASGVCHIHIEIRRVTIDQDWRAPQIAHNLSSGGKCHRRNHDPVARRNSDGFQREVERGRAGIESHGVGMPEISGERALEITRPLARRQPTSFQRRDDFLNFGGGQTGFVEWNFHRVWEDKRWTDLEPTDAAIGRIELVSVDEGKDERAIFPGLPDFA